MWEAAIVDLPVFLVAVVAVVAFATAFVAPQEPLGEQKSADSLNPCDTRGIFWMFPGTVANTPHESDIYRNTMRYWKEGFRLPGRSDRTCR